MWCNVYNMGFFINQKYVKRKINEYQQIKIINPQIWTLPMLTCQSQFVALQSKQRSLNQNFTIVVTAI